MLLRSKRFRPALPALLLLLVFLGACAREATVFYTSDTHGRLASDSATIGMDTVAALRKSVPGALLVDAGDFLQGNPTVNLSQGKDAVRLMKMAGYQAAALGNHEFDYGLETLEERMAEAAAEPRPLLFLSANVLRADGKPLARTAAVFSSGGLKIGIFGLTTEETAVQSHPRNTQGLLFADVLETARQMAHFLRGQGCDVVVALAHVGTEGTMGVKSTDIAAQVPDIDVIIDGHSHVVLEQRAPGGGLVVSGGAHNQHVGRLVLTRASRPAGASGENLTVQNTLLGKADVASVTPDPDVAAAIAQVLAERADVLARVVGRTPVDLNAERAAVRTGGTNFGNLCADALLFATGADAAIVNGGNLRASIKAGPITRGDLIAALPFGDAVLTKRVSGAQLREILEHGLARLPEENGGFPQVGGLKMTVDGARPAGRRITALTLANGKAVSAKGMYTLAVSDFLAAGGDGYPVLAGLPVQRAFLSPDALLLEYINARGDAAFKNIAASRITVRGRR